VGRLSRTPACPDCGWLPDGELWPTEGPRAVWWIQTYCIAGEGDWYGQPLVLRQDQKRSLYRWYEFCGNCGRWRYNQWIRSEATGGGKTTFVAAVEVLELAGPPEISPVSPNVVSMANSWDQANKLFGAASIMCGGREGHKVAESPIKDHFEVYESVITRKDGRPGEINRVAAVAATNEGGLPSTQVVDEAHELGDVGQGRARAYVVINKSTKKRRLRCEIPVTSADGKVTVRQVQRGSGRTIIISTAGFDVDHSMFGRMYKRGKRVRDKPELDPRLLFEVWEAADDLDFSKPEDRRVAVQQASPAAGVLWDIEERVREWDKDEIEHNEWARYYGNRWEKVPEDSWLKEHPAAWGKCQGAWTVTGDEPVVLPVDMSLTRDSTAVGRLTLLPDERIAASARIWKPSGGQIDHLDVMNHIRAQAKVLGRRLRGVVYDPRFFELPARMLEDEGIPCIQFDQSPALMAPACGETFDMILAGQIVWGGDPAFAEWDEEFGRQVLAAAKRQQERGFTLSKGKSKRRIDSAITLCMGVHTLKRVKPARNWANTVY
jgi:phage terminase large subunit-like protein